MPALADDFWTFFPPGKERDPEAAQEAEKKAEQIVLRKGFELQRDKVLKVIYDSPGMMIGGRLLFVTVGRKVQIDITVMSGWNQGIMSTLNTLLSTFLVFTPEGFYDEKSGARIRDEAATLG